MALICPTVTAENPHQYREQIERVAPFALFVHVDFMDGDFSPSKSPGIKQAWWPHTMQADLHIMYQNPTDHITAAIDLNPRLVIVHAEADGSFVQIAKQLHDAGIKAGVALLPETPATIIESALDHIDHVLIFSGSLGHFGGVADLKLVDKVSSLRALKPDLEIGWDGGINKDNVQDLVAGGVDILNVGGYIQRADHPEARFTELRNLLK